jgi:hypothetical protein
MKHLVAVPLALRSWHPRIEVASQVEFLVSLLNHKFSATLQSKDTKPQGSFAGGRKYPFVFPGWQMVLLVRFHSTGQVGVGQGVPFKAHVGERA